MRIALLAALGLAASLAPARALENFSCKVEDAQVKFTVGAQTRDVGRLFDFGGTLEIARPGLAPDFRNLRLGNDHLAQNWVDGQELKLAVHHRRTEAPYGLVTLVIETRVRDTDESSFRGSYTLVVYDEPAAGREAQLFTLRGAVACTAQ